MNTIKQYDWFATRFMNPEKGVDALIVENITPENSKMETRDVYRKKAKVQEMFTDENGNFMEGKFNDYYDQLAFEYAYFSAINTENYILDSYEKSEVDFSTNFGKVKEHKLSTEFIKNPDKISFGLTGFNERSEKELSDRELSQMNKYWDNEKQAWSENTVNEEGLWGRLAGQPLVYATWDNDGTHIDSMTGEEVVHYKGERKTDHWGNYYTETAENKEMLGKQYVTWSEVLTDDTKWTNTLDIFDSDDIDQNIFKTLIRSGAIAALYLIPYTRPYMAYSTAAIQFGRALPQIVKTFSSLTDENAQFDKLNTWDNYMQQFGHSHSDYSQEHLFSFESVMDMAVQSLTQLCQQRAVGQLFGGIGTKNLENSSRMSGTILMANADKQLREYWKKNPKIFNDIIKSTQMYGHAEKAAKAYTKLGEYASRGYLIATSTQDTYRIARQYGFDTQTSSIISLATMVGVGTLFSTDYFRGMLYNSSDYELSNKIKLMQKAYIENNKQALGVAATKVGTAEGKKALFSNVTNGIKDFYNKHVKAMTTGQFGVIDGMINESLEEVSEEVVADIAIQLGKGWNALKSAYTGKEYTNNYSYLESDPLKRYATAFVGGAIGGGVFRMADRLYFQKTAFKQWNDMLKDNDAIMNELVLLVSQGKKDLILKSWNDLENSSMITGNISVFTKQPTDNNAETVHSVVFSSFKKHIEDMDSFLSGHNLKINKKLFDDIELARGLRASWVGAHGLQDALFKDYMIYVRKSVDIGAKLNELNVALETANEGDKKNIESRIKELNKELEFYKDGVRNILDAKDDSYLGRLMMQSNPNIADAILPDTTNSIARRLYNTDYDKLDAAFKQRVDDEYQKLKDSGILEMRYYKAWNIYKELSTSEELQKSILDNVGKIDNLSNLVGSSINSLGTFGNLEFNETIDNNSAFFLLTNILNGVNFNGRPIDHQRLNLLAAKILGIKKLPDYIQIKSDFLNKYDYNTISTTINKYFNDLATWIKDNKNKKSAVPEKYGALVNVDEKVRNIYRDYLLSQALTWVGGNINGNSIISEGGIDRINYSGLLNSIDILLKSIGYKNINSLEIISELNAKRRELGSSFRLSKEQEAQLNIIREGISVLSSITQGAYDQYTIFLNEGIPFGANNFLNQAFKDKKINLKLFEIDSNKLAEMSEYLNLIDYEVKDIIETARELNGQSASLDKKTSYKYLTQQLDQIRGLFLNILPKENFDIDSIIDTEIKESVNDIETDEFYIENSIVIRNIILKFERDFYKYFTSLSESDKIGLIEKIKQHCNNHELIINDTSNISVKSDILFKSTDLFHYLMQTSYNHQSAVADYYKHYHDSRTEQCPFDTQEYVITSVLKLLYDNESRDLWLNAFQSTIDEHNSKVKNENEVINSKVAKNLIKLICFGGTGKSSTILPSIFYGIQHLFKNKKCHFMANTEKQLNNLIVNMDKHKIGISEELSKTFISEFLSLSEQDFEKTYKNSIIFIDECTNISVNDWLKLDQWCEKYNVKIIAAGDTTQVGESTNIDQIVTISTPQLQDSKRTFSDIMTYNLLFWERMQKIDNGALSYTSKNLFELLYYKELGKTFEGVYIENQEQGDITEEYIENFIASHPLSDNTEKSILIFTNKENEIRLTKKYANGYNGYSITIVPEIDQTPDGKTISGYKLIQGSEWDYVFSDVDLETKNVNDYSEDFKEGATIYSNRVKETYTLVSRARHGFVSTKPFIYGAFDDSAYTISHDENNFPSKYPPIYTGINKDVVDNFKNYKAAVLAGLIYDDDEGKTGDEAPVVEPVTVINTITKQQMVECSPGFVWRADDELAKSLKIDRKEWDKIRMIVYKSLTENNPILLQQLSEEWRSGEFLIKFQETKGILLEPLGNWGRSDDIVSGCHPWIVYSIKTPEGRRDIHLGMFHNGKAFKEMPLDVTQVTQQLNDLHKVGEKGPIYYQINWDKIKFARSNNPISIQPEQTRSEIYQHLKYDGTSISFTTNTSGQSYSFMNTSAPIFVKKGDDSIVNITELLKVLEEQKKLLADAYKVLIQSGLYQGNDIHNILEVIGIERKIDKTTGKFAFKARESLPIDGEIISFIKLNDGTNNLTLLDTLKQWSAQYIFEQSEKNKQIREIIQAAESKNNTNEEKRNKINKILSNNLISQVSILVYGKAKVVNVTELENIFDNLQTDGDKEERLSYNNKISSHLWNVFLKIYTIANNAEDLKTIISKANYDGLTSEEIDAVVKLYNKYKPHFTNTIEKVKLPDNFFEIITDKSFESYNDKIKDFIKNNLEFFKELYGFTSSEVNWHKILQKLNYKQSWFSKEEKKLFKPLTLVTYSTILADNNISILTSSLNILTKTRDLDPVSFTIDKVVQPAQIYMYVDGEIKDGITKLSENTSTPVTNNEIIRPEGNWKYVVKSKEGNDIQAEYKAHTDQDGFTHIEHVGSIYTAITFINYSDPTVPTDFYIGNENQFETLEDYRKVKEQVETTGLKIKKVTIRPDGIITITFDGFYIEGEPARVIYNQYFKAENFKNEPKVSVENPSTSIENKADVVEELKNWLNIKNNFGKKSVINKFMTLIKPKLDQERATDIIEILRSIDENEYIELFHYILTNDESIFNNLSDKSKYIINDLKEYSVLIDENNNFKIC